MMTPVLSAQNLSRRYLLPRSSLFSPRPVLQAVQGVSLTLNAGDVLGIVGESGSGKSTLARLLMALERPDSGSITCLGQPISSMSMNALRPLRRKMQMVFQDPFGSLNPRLRVLDIVAEPLDVAEPALPPSDRAARVRDLLARVGLEARMMRRYPHEFSGGQRQRIAIARALITNPNILIADEPVSALDVSIQAQILNLLIDLKAEFELSMIIISHDLGVIRTLADRVIVMKAGQIVEEGPSEVLFTAPRHAYTQELIAASLL